MIYRIKKYSHRAWPPCIGLWFAKKHITKRVRFLPSCKYYLSGADMYDTCKLFGIGYLWHHHKDSARFGWRYDTLRSAIVLSAYCYVDGERVIKDFYVAAIHELLCLKIAIAERHYVFSVKDERGNLMASCSIPFNHKKKIGYPLGPYFGGNKPSPQLIEIEIKNN